MRNRQPYRPQVFLSYYARGSDLEMAASLRSALLQNKVRIPAWRDKEEIQPGTPGIRKITAAIADCDFFLALMSPRSATKSKWCSKERLRADRLGKPIIPLLLEEIPAKDLPLELEGEQYVNLTQGIPTGLPAILTRLGVADSPGPIDRDPLDRDNERLDAFASVLRYLKAILALPSATGQVFLRTLAPCLETERARNIVEAATRMTFQDCPAMAEWILAKWRGRGA